MFLRCHVQGMVHLSALSLKWQCYQQMSGAGDLPAEHEECLKCRRVCDGEQGRDICGKCSYLPSQLVDIGG